MVTVPVRRGRLRGRAIGQGSTATVYLATNASAPVETYAVKSAELSRSAPLQREHGFLSSLRSPHLVACLGADLTTGPDGRVYYNLLMEYVPGGTLAEETKRRGGLDEGRIRWRTRGILHGLAYLHSMGIAHGDVKGQNILVGADDGCVKLADLGCARWVSSRNFAGGRTGGLVIGGTPMYMAPEVARGEQQGTAADIWALGCTVIEMATGCPPWPDVTDPIAAIHRIGFSDDVPEFPCGVSDVARDFLGRCLNREPVERWSAEQLVSHPFLKHSREELNVECTPESKKKENNSPKSTLEQGFWDSWVEVEEMVEGTANPQVDGWKLESPEERLRQMIGGSIPQSPPADSTWKESCWILVRTGEEPSTSASCLREARGGGGGSGTEAPASRSENSVVAEEGYLTSNSFCHSFSSDARLHPRITHEFNRNMR